MPQPLAISAALPLYLLTRTTCIVCADHGEDETDEDDGEFPGGRLLGYDEVRLASTAGRVQPTHSAVLCWHIQPPGARIAWPASVLHGFTRQGN